MPVLLQSLPTIHDEEDDYEDSEEVEDYSDDEDSDLLRFYLEKAKSIQYITNPRRKLTFLIDLYNIIFLDFCLKTTGF